MTPTQALAALRPKFVTPIKAQALAVLGKLVEAASKQKPDKSQKPETPQDGAEK